MTRFEKQPILVPEDSRPKLFHVRPHLSEHRELAPLHADSQLIPEKKKSWHDALDALAMAAKGLLVVSCGTLVASPSAAASMANSAQATTPEGKSSSTGVGTVSPHDVNKALVHAISGSRPDLLQAKDSFHDAFVVHVSEHIDAEADHTIDIVVEAHQEKPSETEVKDAKTFLRELHREILKQLTEPAPIASGLITVAVQGSWLMLLYMSARTREAAHAKKNPILKRMARAFGKLGEIFDPSHASQPKSQPIVVVAQQLNCSETEAAAVLKAGPFVETSPGHWELRAPFGALQNKPGPHLDNCTFSF